MQRWPHLSEPRALGREWSYRTVNSHPITERRMAKEKWGGYIAISDSSQTEAEFMLGEAPNLHTKHP